MKHKTQSRTVDFGSNSSDLVCAVLGEAGWYTRAIAQETNLTESQVNYRLGRAGIKRADYRNGTSEIAQHTLKQIKARGNAKRLESGAQKLSRTIDDLQQRCIDALEESKSKSRISSSLQ